MRELRNSPLPYDASLGSYPRWLLSTTLALLIAGGLLFPVSPTSAQTEGDAHVRPATVVANPCVSPSAGADLRRCDFAYRTLRGADLAGVDLRGVNLSFADLTGVRLEGARLDGAKLTSATLRGADLRRARLIDSDLRLADLTGAELDGADASGAELSNAAIDPSMLPRITLTDTIGPFGMLCSEPGCDGSSLHVDPLRLDGERIAAWARVHLTSLPESLATTP